MITVSATAGYFPGPARTRLRSNSFPVREISRGGLNHSALAGTMIKAAIFLRRIAAAHLKSG